MFFDGAPRLADKEAGRGYWAFLTRRHSRRQRHPQPFEKVGQSGKETGQWFPPTVKCNPTRAMQAEVVSSDEFAKMISQSDGFTSSIEGERVVSEQELEEWMKMFGGREQRIRELEIARTAKFTLRSPLDEARL
ncbi:MAG: hypothetical protein U0X93_07110 [Anaerolineales bacterium]